MIEEANMFLSDCGKYIAVRSEEEWACLYDVIAVDGTRIWLSRKFDTHKVKDNNPRIIYPEFEHEVIAFSNKGYENMAGRWVYDFVLSFADLDKEKKIKPLTGNCIIKEYEARFRKPIKQLVRSKKVKK